MQARSADRSLCFDETKLCWISPISCCDVCKVASCAIHGANCVANNTESTATNVCLAKQINAIGEYWSLRMNVFAHDFMLGEALFWGLSSLLKTHYL